MFGKAQNLLSLLEAWRSSGVQSDEAERVGARRGGRAKSKNLRTDKVWGNHPGQRCLQLLTRIETQRLSEFEQKREAEIDIG